MWFFSSELPKPSPCGEEFRVSDAQSLGFLSVLFLFFSLKPDSEQCVDRKQDSSENHCADAKSRKKVASGNKSSERSGRRLIP